MCLKCRKGLEFTSMIVLYIYSITTMGYVIAEFCLSILMLILINDDMIEIAMGTQGILLSTVHYFLALACMTATVRMVQISDKLVG